MKTSMRAISAVFTLALALLACGTAPRHQDPPKPVETKACECRLCSELAKKKIDPAGTTLELSIELDDEGRVTDKAAWTAVTKFLNETLQKDADLKTVPQKYTTTEEQKKAAEYAKGKMGWPEEAEMYKCEFDAVVFAGSKRVAFFEVEHERVFKDGAPDPKTQAQWIKYARVAEATGIPVHIVVPDAKKGEARTFLEACLEDGRLTDRRIVDRVWGFKVKP